MAMWLRGAQEEEKMTKEKVEHRQVLKYRINCFLTAVTKYLTVNLREERFIMAPGFRGSHLSSPRETDGAGAAPSLDAELCTDSSPHLGRLENKEHQPGPEADVTITGTAHKPNSVSQVTGTKIP